jgi:uncharacterized membrane protein YidH (DUF202 family)
MKMNQLLGILLIVFGVLALAYQGFTYTTREKAIDLGPVEVTTERTRLVSLPPIVGAMAVVGGILILVAGRKKS